MNTKHRKSSHQKRRLQADPGAMARVFARVQPFTASEITTLTIPLRQSWESFCNGSADAGDFNTLAAAANVCMILAEHIGEGRELAIEAIRRAQDALLITRERFRRCGKWGTDHLSREHIPILLDIYDQFLELCTPLQMHQAMETVQRRVLDGHILEITA